MAGTSPKDGTKLELKPCLLGGKIECKIVAGPWGSLVPQLRPFPEPRSSWFPVRHR